MSVDRGTTGAVNSTRKQSPKAKRGWRGLVLVLLLLALGFGILAWRNPLWLVDKQVDARLRLQGVHSEFVTVNGYKMHYLVGGSGRPLVLVHGLGSRGLDWANLIPQLIAGWPSRICRGFAGIWALCAAQGCELLHLGPGSHGRRVSG